LADSQLVAREVEFNDFTLLQLEQAILNLRSIGERDDMESDMTDKPKFDPGMNLNDLLGRKSHHEKLVKLTAALKDCFDPEFHSAFGEGVVMGLIAETVVSMALSMNEERKNLPWTGTPDKEAAYQVDLKLRNDGQVVLTSYSGGTFPLECVWQADSFDQMDLILGDPNFPEGNVSGEDGEPLLHDPDAMSFEEACVEAKKIIDKKDN
jgi:hypothetical protein